ncbi:MULTISPECIES: TonB-dependent receptor [unclassified Pseudoalteromonas]|uniref:TonB-dependent receptor n=1 Tax=unclassified Pseudoalteromonas TaxID=194690 RepID=UPI0025B3D3AF|nr:MULTISPECIES: TonB-dependent receptor [unclassified Pseudoalteromonas]MDN3379970.1 TonB-dependent receptor [Pseudoalteromonas sp. APC 3893]MDN3388309.1 TonB-dependent receptor [Pseudoalteromonas sp. APC 4017]
MRLFIVTTALLASPISIASEKNNIERITTTASRAEVSADPLPLVISSITQAQLDLIAPTHIEQVLKKIAGANVQHGNGQEYLPALRSPVLSGAGACGGILTAEDGIPLRAAGFCNINELFEAHTEMAERVEVLKGPGSALYGSNAVHGVINVITPDTTYDEHLLGLDLGSYGYSRFKLRSGKDLDNQGIGINASVTHDTGYRDDESVDQEKLNLRHRYTNDELSITTGLSYTNLDQKTAGFIEGFESYKDDEIAQQNFDPDAFREASSFRLWSKAQWQTEQDMLTITPYVRNQSMTFFKHFLPGTPLEENSQSGVGIQSLWQHAYSNTFTLNLGLDSEYTRADFLQYQDQPTQGSDFLIATVPQGKHYDYNVTSILLAPFVSLDWQWQALSVSLGARFERLNYDYTNNMLAGRTDENGNECGFGGCRYSRPPSSENTFTNTSPKLGLSYQLTANNYLYANLSKGYRAPQAAELYQLQRDQQVADLESETADNLEFGFKGQYQQLHYVFSAYAMNKENVIFRDSDFFTVNDGQTQHRGIELELDYQLTDTLQLALAASHAKHTYSYDQTLSGININSNEIDTAPRNVANLQANWQITNNTLVALEWHHVSDYFTDPENQHNYAGHNLLNLRATWQATEQLKLTARINNLMDTAYAERADYTSFTGDRYFPGDPRNIMISASFNW